MDIYIIRHGETDWNKDKRVQGSTDIELNNNGIDLAKLTAQNMKKEGISFDRIFSSPLKRAFQTAEIFAETFSYGTQNNANKILSSQSMTKLDITKDNLITEICYGAAEGVTMGELHSNPKYKGASLLFLKPESYIPEGKGETFVQVINRCHNFLNEKIIPLEDKCESVLVSCHGGIARALLFAINNWPISRFWEISEPNCAVNKVTLKQGHFEIDFTGKTYYTVTRKGIL